MLTRRHLRTYPEVFSKEISQVSRIAEHVYEQPLSQQNENKDRNKIYASYDEGKRKDTKYDEQKQGNDQYGKHYAETHWQACDYVRLEIICPHAEVFPYSRGQNSKNGPVLQNQLSNSIVP